MQKRRVVITGMGVATPIGLGIEPFWDALIQRKSGVRRIEAFDPSGLAATIGGELPAFSLADFIPKTYRKSAKVMARDIVIAVVCAYQAVRDAGLTTKCIIDRGEGEAPPNLDSRRFGANIGAGLICADLEELAGALATSADDAGAFSLAKCIIDRGEGEAPPNLDSRRFGANIGAGLICADLEELAGALATSADDAGAFSLAKWGAEGMTNLTPLWLLKFLPNMLACHVTIVHDAQAPSNTLTCAEASSHLAIGEAFRTIARGDADVCICGGAESKINPMAMIRPQLWGRLNVADNETPERASRPFGAGRRGMVVSEGGGLVILESLDHAQTRGARIYAEVAGFGASTNTQSWSGPDPAGRGIAIALSKSMKDAGISLDRIDLVAPFAVGTPEHDASEMAGWTQAFGDRLGKIPAMSARGAIGNNGAGAGAIDFAAVVMALHRNTAPPSLNTERLDPACGFRFVQGDPVDVPITHAVSLGYALSGGQCASLVLRKFQE